MDYTKYEKEELINFLEERDKIIKKNKYGLQWDKDSNIEQSLKTCKNHIPIIKNIEEKNINNNSSITHILIEGENLHTLLSLQSTHSEKIDVIYIDPPYNTGNKDFIYNDQLVDKEDGYRHSKWLSFMEKRLKLARNLLKDDGVIFISIDDNEMAQLRLLCDQVFGEDNFVNMIAIKMSEPVGVKMTHAKKRLPKLKEYVIFYKKSNVNIIPPLIKKNKWDDQYSHLVRGITKKEIDYLKEILYSSETDVNEIEIADKICENIYLEPIENLFAENNAKTDEEKLKLKYQNSWRIVRWVSTSSGAKKIADDKKLINKHDFFTILTPQLKKYLIKSSYNDDVEQPNIKILFADKYLLTNPGDFWQDIKTTALWSEGGVCFKNGKKPLEMIKRLINLHPNTNALVLDFFAGSGTTGHAVLDLNKEDGGNRQFILCTNNENGICKKFTYPRIKNIIEELGGNLSYFQTNNIRCVKNEDQMNYDISNKCDALLCLEYNIFNIYEQKNEYTIYVSNRKNKYLCINNGGIYGDEFKDFIRTLENLKGEKYIFISSMYEDINKNLFKTIKNIKLISNIKNNFLKKHKQIIKTLD